MNCYKNITLEKEKYLEINSYDIKYNISISNKDTERKEKLIFINTKKMRDLIDNEHVDNFFMDITYQIIPKNRKPYKILTLSCINSETNTANICCLIGLIYEDYLSIFYCLKYLHDIYKFNPKYIHIDYIKAERKALVQKNLFDIKPTIISCFFHFSQCLYKKLIKYNIIKKKLSKRAFELLRNYELICFINPGLINKFKNFLNNNMIDENEKKFFTYVNNNWLNKDPKIYNYYVLIKENSDYNNKLKKYFYTTNNIAESLHAKISSYIPKHKISNKDFLYCIKNILNLNEIKINKIKRKDFITRSLIKISLDMDNDNFNWITYEEYKKIQKEIIAIDTDIIDNNTLENLIDSINELNLKNKEDKNNLLLNDNTEDNINIGNKFDNLEDDIEINDYVKDDEHSLGEIINENIIEESDSSKEEDIEDINICNLLKEKNRLSIDLLDRILEKVSLDNYEGIIKIIKLKKKKSKKR